MTDSPNRSTDGSSLSAVHIEEVDAFDQLITNNERVLVDFYADWCGPCQLMAPLVDELAAESDSAIVKVDVEALPQIATRYDVRSIPTFIAIEDGAVETRLVGMQERSALARITD